MLLFNNLQAVLEQGNPPAGGRGSPWKEAMVLQVKESVCERIMHRVGVSLPPAQFIYEVARAYEAIQTANSPPSIIEPRLRCCHSYPVFQQALREGGPAASTLILGCGEGLCGLDDSYARTEWGRAWPNTSKVDSCLLSPPVLWDESRWPKDQYGAIVSHSMVHYVYNLDQYFRLVDRALLPGGTYVMGHEVSARFWLRPELVSATAKLRQDLRGTGRWKRLADPKAYWRRIGKYLHVEEPLDLTAQINLVLRRRLKTTEDVTSEEISRLVEIHRPLEKPCDLQIGRSGFDVDELSRTYFSDYELVWSGSSGFTGFTHPDHLPPHWRERDAELSRRFPNDGVYFSACWRKKT